MGRGLNAEGIIGAYYVMDYGSAKGDGVSPDDAALKAADAAAQAAGAGAVLLIANQHRVSSNLTITSPTLYLAGGQLLPDAGVLVNHAGDVQGRVKSFAGSGAVVVTSGCPTRPEWWGGVGTASWLYLPDGWDATWQAAKLASLTSPRWLTFIGDSVSTGAVSDDYLNHGFPGLLRAFLASHYNVTGDYYSEGQSAGFMNGGGPFTLTSTGAVVGTGINRYAQWSGTPANPGSFTSPYACTDMDLVYGDVYAGTWTFTIDGGANGTVSSPTGGTVAAVGGAWQVTCTGTGKLNVIKVTGLTSAAHTVVATGQSSDYVIELRGIATYTDRTKGLWIGRAFASGESVVFDHGQLGGGGLDKTLYWQGYQSNAGNLNAMGFPTAPALAIIELGINDAQNNYGLAAYKGGLARMCDALRRGYPGCSILLIGPSNPGAASSDVTSNNFTNAALWRDYLAAMKAIADDYRAAFLNIHAKWGSNPVAKGFAAASQPHPTTAGHADIAAVLEALV